MRERGRQREDEEEEGELEKKNNVMLTQNIVQLLLLFWIVLWKSAKG